MKKMEAQSIITKDQIQAGLCQGRGIILWIKN